MWCIPTFCFMISETEKLHFCLEVFVLEFYVEINTGWFNQKVKLLASLQ
jgi:hypothetical protein